MIFAAALSALLMFTPMKTPPSFPHAPSFQLGGWSPEDRNATLVPLYIPETDETRAVAVVRFTPPVSGLCKIFEVTADNQAFALRVSQYGSSILVEKGQEVRIAAALRDADDIKSDKLALDARHRTIGVYCVDGTTGKILYSNLYHYDVEPVTSG